MTLFFFFLFLIQVTINSNTLDMLTTYGEQTPKESWPVML